MQSNDIFLRRYGSALRWTLFLAFPGLLMSTSVPETQFLSSLVYSIQSDCTSLFNKMILIDTPNMSRIQCDLPSLDFREPVPLLG